MSTLTLQGINYLCYSHACSNANGILIKPTTTAANAIIAANSEVIQHLRRNMDDDMQPCVLACFPGCF